MTLETNSKNLETEPDTVNSEQNSDSFKTDEKVEFIAIIKRDENKSVVNICIGTHTHIHLYIFKYLILENIYKNIYIYYSHN